MECNGYNTFRGLFFRAWEDGYLESRKFREELGRKTKAYVMTIILGIVVNLLPDYTINGMVADETLSFLIYLAMVVAECFSIVENLKDMGISQASFIRDSILTVLQKAGVTLRRDDDMQHAFYDGKIFKDGNMIDKPPVVKSNEQILREKRAEMTEKLNSVTVS